MVLCACEFGENFTGALLLRFNITQLCIRIPGGVSGSSSSIAMVLRTHCPLAVSRAAHAPDDIRPRDLVRPRADIGQAEFSVSGFSCSLNNLVKLHRTMLRLAIVLGLAAACFAQTKPNIAETFESSVSHVIAAAAAHSLLA